METEAGTAADEQRQHEIKIATIKVRAEAFAASPIWFTAWDITGDVIRAVFWIAFWSVVAQCTCDGCVWGQP